MILMAFGTKNALDTFFKQDAAFGRDVSIAFNAVSYSVIDKDGNVVLKGLAIRDMNDVDNQKGQHYTAVLPHDSMFRISNSTRVLEMLKHTVLR